MGRILVNFMKHIMAAEKLAQGPASEEQLRLESVFFERIIPRLIRPLETGGRQIQPRLVHSDLWDGNAAVNVEDGGSRDIRSFLLLCA